MEEGVLTVLEPVKDPQYMVTPYIEDLVRYSLAYLKADFPLHFCGPAGAGKTSLAMHVACLLGRPIVIIHGDEEFKTSDLVGAEYGFRLRRVRDRYISTVTKTEEDMVKSWVDNRLTVACKHGFTLIYDEFTRSRPEANNVLLAVLEEKMLDLPSIGSEERYLQVHPDFRAIFTSNPEEYAGIYTAQDALRNRLVTIDLSFFDEETEVGITVSKSGLPKKDAVKIVKIVRAFRKQGAYKHPPTIRESIKIAKVIKTNNFKVSKNDSSFLKICMHVLTNDHHSLKTSKNGNTKNGNLVVNLVKEHA